MCFPINLILYTDFPCFHLDLGIEPCLEDIIQSASLFAFAYSNVILFMSNEALSHTNRTLLQLFFLKWILIIYLIKRDFSPMYTNKITFNQNAILSLKYD